MNVVPFEVKRAHWGMTSTAQREFWRVAEKEGKVELFEMTPARYDILHMIAERFWWRQSTGRNRPRPDTQMPLAELIRVLGLHPSTISKTVKRMKELGLVISYRKMGDLRSVIVAITDKGWRCLKAARKVITRPPRGFIRGKLGTWFRGLNLPDSIVSQRTAQRWANRLASVFGMRSEPIYDMRYTHNLEAYELPYRQEMYRGHIRSVRNVWPRRQPYG